MWEHLNCKIRYIVFQVLLKPAQVAIIILAFATYTLEPIHDSCRSSDVPVKCLAALAICKFVGHAILVKLMNDRFYV